MSNPASGCEELYDAAAKGDFDRVADLVTSTKGGAACTEKGGFTPLHGVASGHGVLTEDDLRIAQYLIDHGADVEATADNGATPLNSCPYPEMIELLVKNGANLEATDDGGATALLYYAEDSNGPDALAKALALGANPNHQDDRGRTALDTAIKRQERRKVDLLIRHGAARAVLSKELENGAYSVFYRRAGDEDRFKLMESPDEIGEIKLCVGERDYVFIRGHEGKAWVNLAGVHNGILTQLGEVDSLDGVIECEGDQVSLVTETNSYSFSRSRR